MSDASECGEKTLSLWRDRRKRRAGDGRFRNKEMLSNSRAMRLAVNNLHPRNQLVLIEPFKEDIF